MATRLSDEELKWLSSAQANGSVVSAMIEELIGCRAAEAKAWHCVRLLFRMIDQKDWYNDAIPDDVRRVAREVGIDLTD